MKLNPKKCTFGVEEGMFLGYTVNTKGLKVCPEKGIKRFEDKLYINGEISAGLGTCQQVPKEILSSTPNHSDFGPADTTGAIKTERSREATEVEHQIKRICNTLQTQSVSQGADISRLHNGYGAGLILTNPEGMEFTYALRFRFNATNNEAEYEALIAGMRIAEQMGVKNLQENVDSRLVANQVNETYIAK
nr:reverse transcriptase domain-containing protein [Tanacetum cinerariifolium]